jgi:hypothetical protein
VGLLQRLALRLLKAEGVLSAEEPAPPTPRLLERRLRELEREVTEVRSRINRLIFLVIFALLERAISNWL